MELDEATELLNRVPEWAIDSAATYQALPDSGHMMMLEQPHRLATLLGILVYRGHVEVP